MWFIFFFLIWPILKIYKINKIIFRVFVCGCVCVLTTRKINNIILITMRTIFFISHTNYFSFTWLWLQLRLLTSTPNLDLDLDFDSNSQLRFWQRLDASFVPNSLQCQFVCSNLYMLLFIIIIIIIIIIDIIIIVFKVLIAFTRL